MRYKCVYITVIYTVMITVVYIYNISIVEQKLISNNFNYVVEEICMQILCYLRDFIKKKKVFVLNNTQ